MTPSEEQDRLEKAQAEQFINEVPRLKGVEGARVELGDDQTGDPSMWLVFQLNPDVNFDLEEAHRFHQYAAAIQTKILHSGIKRFPYTRVEQAS